MTTIITVAKSIAKFAALAVSLIAVTFAIGVAGGHAVDYYLTKQ